MKVEENEVRRRRNSVTEEEEKQEEEEKKKGKGKKEMMVFLFLSLKKADLEKPEVGIGRIFNFYIYLNIFKKIFIHSNHI